MERLYNLNLSRWNRISQFIFRDARHIQISGYLLTANALLVGLKVKLIGGDSLAILIDPDLLLCSILIMILSIAFWGGTVVFTFIKIPPEIQDYFTYHDYIEGKRKSVFSEDDFKHSYGIYSEQWDDLNTAHPNPRAFILLLIWASLFLGLLSLCVLLLSFSGVLREIILRVQGY